MKQPARRTFLGRDSSWAERVRVYRTDDALEVAYATTFEITLLRVFYDEVRLITLHRSIGSAAKWVLFVITGIFALCTLALRGSALEAFYVFLALAALLGTAALASALVPIWTVCVYGRRTRARMRFALRPGRARTLFADLCRRASTAQRELAAAGASAAAATAASEEFPAPPPASAVAPGSEVEPAAAPPPAAEPGAAAERIDERATAPPPSAEPGGAAESIEGSR